MKRCYCLYVWCIKTLQREQRTGVSGVWIPFGDTILAIGTTSVPIGLPTKRRKKTKLRQSSMDHNDPLHISGGANSNPRS